MTPTTRDALEKRIRTRINDLNPHQRAISGRIMAEIIEGNGIEISEELPYQTVRTPAAITLTSGASRVAFLPAVDISAVVAVILDSVNYPLAQRPLSFIQDLRVGQTPPKATYPYYYAMEEADATGTMYINIFPDYNGPGDSLTTIIAPSGTALPLGTSAVTLAIQGQLALVYRCAVACVQMMTDEQRALRKINPEVLDPQSPRSWIALGEKAMQAESARLFAMDTAGSISQYGRL